MVRSYLYLCQVSFCCWGLSYAGDLEKSLTSICHSPWVVTIKMSPDFATCSPGVNRRLINKIIDLKCPHGDKNQIRLISEANLGSHQKHVLILGEQRHQMASPCGNGTAWWAQDSAVVVELRAGRVPTGANRRASQAETAPQPSSISCGKASTLHLVASWAPAEWGGDHTATSAWEIRKQASRVKSIAVYMDGPQT